MTVTEDTFTPPKPTVELPVPEWKCSLQTTRFPTFKEPYTESLFGKKALGQKHWDYIGKNPSICRKLFGLGAIIQQMVVNGQKLSLGLNEYSNHVWLPQMNEVDSSRMEICLNCKSLLINGRFIPYTDLDKVKQ